MRADVGDWVLPEGRDDSPGALIAGLQHPDGSPPCVVRWLAGGHITLVVNSGPCARLVPAGTSEVGGKP